MKHYVLVLVAALAACGGQTIEGRYHGGDGEGMEITLLLEKDKAQLWQDNKVSPPLEGKYYQMGERILLEIGGRTLVLVPKDGCLIPEGDPSQALCKR